jgi:putative hydrolase of HD superfamily
MQNDILKLASLVLDFGKVHRQTCHQDGVTLESDTDHTVMLGILGTALADRLYPDLNLGIVAQFALVHDLVEVYAGDTPTLMGVNEEFFNQKEQREQLALQKIKTEFGGQFGWVHRTIEKYDTLGTKEARFVKVLDKILPKITVVLNNAKNINDKKLATKEGVLKTFALQREQVKKWAVDMPELLNLWEFFVARELELIMD